MKIRDLIAKLKDLDPDLRVIIRTPGNQLLSLSEPIPGACVKYALPKAIELFKDKCVFIDGEST